MKTRFLLGFLLTAILLTMMTASALDFTVSTNTIELSKNVNSASFTVSSVADNTVTIPASVNVADGSGNIITVTLSPNGVQTIAAGTSKTINVSYSGALPAKLELGSLPGVPINLVSGIDTKTVTLNFVSSFCSKGASDTYTEASKTYELEMSIKNIDLTGFGNEKDNEWYLLDKVEIEVNVDNIGNENVNDILIEACLYDKAKNKCVVDESDMELDDNFNLKDGKEENVILSYQVNPDEIDQAGDYVLYVKAYSDDLGEGNLCLEDSETVTIVEDNFVLLDNVVLPESVECGGSVELTADAWNIGDDDQADVYMVVYNQELGLNEKVLIEDIDSWDKQDVTASFDIPQNAKEKTYLLELRVFDEDDDIFETENDDQAKFTYNIKVEGNCATSSTGNTSADALITVELVSDAIAGEQLVVKGTIKNTGTQETTYVVNAQDYSSWAALDKIDTRLLTIEPGESEDFNIYFNVNEDASGEQFFKIVSDFGGKTKEQEVSVAIEGKTSGITGGAIGASLRENWFIWVIVIINIILIIAIIAVARRIATTSK